jgi:hypothetical protein
VGKGGGMERLSIFFSFQRYTGTRTVHGTQVRGKHIVHTCPWGKGEGWRGCLCFFFFQRYTVHSAQYTVHRSRKHILRGEGGGGDVKGVMFILFFNGTQYTVHGTRYTVHGTQYTGPEKVFVWVLMVGCVDGISTVDIVDAQFDARIARLSLRRWWCDAETRTGDDRRCAPPPGSLSRRASRLRAAVPANPTART